MPHAERWAQEAFAAFTGVKAAFEERYGYRYGSFAPGAAPDGAGLAVATVQGEIDRWQHTRFPEYARQIEERVDGARVQLVDDVLAQLHSSFVELRRTLVLLNGALRSCAFGKDRYEFTWTPADRLRPFRALATELAPRFERAGAWAAAGGSAYELLAEDERLRRRLDELVEALTGRAASPEAQLADIVDYLHARRVNVSRRRSRPRPPGTTRSRAAPTSPAAGSRAGCGSRT